MRKQIVANDNRVRSTEGRPDFLKLAIDTIARFELPEPVAPPVQADPNRFDPCAPPSTRTAPQFEVPFRRAILFPDLCVPVDLEGKGDADTPGIGPLLFNCAKPTRVTFCLSPDLRFKQLWNLTGLSIGDLSSTMALAPGEELVIEFQSSQRRVLEENRVDSAEEMTSTESTTAEKEVVNTVQSLSKTQEWHVDGSASYGIPGKLSIEASAGFRSSTTDTSQTTIDHTSEVTNKSAHNLKTLHKIEVRGVSEEIVQNRMTRKIKNPFPDRTFSVNVFQLLKHFDVQTSLTEIRFAFLIEVQGLNFDSSFVITNTDFLRDTLLDRTLVDDLPNALKGADPLPTQNIEKARAAAKLALHYLFDEVVIFNIKDDRSPLARQGGGPAIANPANSPEAGFDAGLDFVFPTGTVLGIPIIQTRRGFVDGSALGDAVVNNLGTIFTTLAYFYRVYQDIKNAPNSTTLLDENAIPLATSVGEFAGKQWTALIEASLGNIAQVENDNISIPRVLRNILDNDSLTEIFRRLSGFVAMYEAMVKPIGGTTDAEKQAVQEQQEAFRSLERLLEHLRCNNNYYTQQFLAYRGAKTKNEAVLSFVKDVIRRVLGSSQAVRIVGKIIDLEHPFIDKQQIIVPGLKALTEEQINDFATQLGSTDSTFTFDDIVPAVLNDLQVPADGIHLEVAEGGCALRNLPEPPRTSLDLVIHDASIRLQSAD